ncbi:hypothetical protein JCM8547_008663 [Rhodosporidiobolus lusitaniae]
MTSPRLPPTPGQEDDSPLLYRSPSSAPLHRLSRSFPSTSRRPISLANPEHADDEEAYWRGEVRRSVHVGGGGGGGEKGEGGGGGGRRKSVGLGLRFGMEGFEIEEGDEEEEPETERAPRPSTPPAHSSSPFTTPPSSPPSSRLPFSPHRSPPSSATTNRHSTATGSTTFSTSTSPSFGHRRVHRPEALSRYSSSATSAASTAATSFDGEGEDSSGSDDSDVGSGGLVPPSFGRPGGRRGKDPHVVPLTPETPYEAFDFPLPPGSTAGSSFFPGLVATAEPESQLEAAAASFSLSSRSVAVFAPMEEEANMGTRLPSYSSQGGGKGGKAAGAVTAVHALEPWAIDPHSLDDDDRAVLSTLLPVEVDNEPDLVRSPQLVPIPAGQQPSLASPRSPPPSLLLPKSTSLPVLTPAGAPSLAASLPPSSGKPSSSLGGFISKSPSFTFGGPSTSSSYTHSTTSSPFLSPIPPHSSSPSSPSHLSPNPSSSSASKRSSQLFQSLASGLGSLGRSRSKSNVGKPGGGGLSVIGEASSSAAVSPSLGSRTNSGKSVTKQLATGAVLPTSPSAASVGGRLGIASPDVPRSPSLWTLPRTPQVALPPSIVPSPQQGRDERVEELEEDDEEEQEEKRRRAASSGSKAARMLGLEVPSSSSSGSMSPRASPRTSPYLPASSPTPAAASSSSSSAIAGRVSKSSKRAPPPAALPLSPPPSHALSHSLPASRSQPYNTISSSSSLASPSYLSPISPLSPVSPTDAAAARTAPSKAAKMLGFSTSQGAGGVGGGGEGKGRKMLGWPATRNNVREYEVALSDLYKLSTVPSTLLHKSKLLFRPRLITLSRSPSSSFTSSPPSFSLHSYPTRALSELETSRLTLLPSSVICAPAEGEAPPSSSAAGRAFAIKVTGAVDALAKDGSQKVERRMGSWVIGMDDLEGWREWMEELRGAVSELRGEKKDEGKAAVLEQEEQREEEVFDLDASRRRARQASSTSGDSGYSAEATRLSLGREGWRVSTYGGLDLGISRAGSFSSTRSGGTRSRLASLAPSHLSASVRGGEEDAYSLYSLEAASSLYSAGGDDLSHLVQAAPPAATSSSSSVRANIPLSASFFDADTSDDDEENAPPVPSSSSRQASLTLPPSLPPPSSALPPPPPGQPSQTHTLTKRLSVASHLCASASHRSLRSHSSSSSLASHRGSFSHSPSQLQLHPSLSASRSRLSVLSFENLPHLAPPPSGPPPKGGLPAIPGSPAVGNEVRRPSVPPPMGPAPPRE